MLLVGEPGSGKTTLGTKLARAMLVPFLARDHVRGGLWCTVGSWSDSPPPQPPGPDAVEAFLGLVETYVGLGVSLVAEYVVREDAPEHLDRITAGARCVVVRTHCDGAPARHTQRQLAEPIVQHPGVIAALGPASLEEHLATSSANMALLTEQMRKTFDLPTIEVTTDGEYEPPMDAIIAFVASAATG